MVFKLKLINLKSKLMNKGVAKYLDDTASQFGDKTAIIIESKSGTSKWTFKQLVENTNQVTNYLKEQGFQKDEVVALMCENRLEFNSIWLALAKLGCVSAFINTNQRMAPLIHSFICAKASKIIYTDTFSPAIDEIKGELKEKIPEAKFFCYSSDSSSTEKVKAEVTYFSKKSLSSYSTFYPNKEIKSGYSDKLFYIYTSGTTGLPKAAVVRNYRFIVMGSVIRLILKFKREDVIYCPLPLYHAAAGIIGLGHVLLNGNTVVFRDKFSATNFWSDAVKHNCSVAQYIGEICRYLYAQPARPDDHKHPIRIMYGNGLRENIWKPFKDRFNLEQIAEIYGSTEGNANTMNYSNVVGACGFLPASFPSFLSNYFLPINLIKVDEDTYEPVRDKNGLCIVAKPGEVGELVGRIYNHDPQKSFDGYVNSDANKKKVYENVFVHGDRAFASGDLMTVDEYGFLYFKDRIGDTYRWKGENVSTVEVETVISNVVKLSDVIVFGVAIPNCEGRAGMVVFADPNGTVDIGSLGGKLNKLLPSYAVPYFIRVTDSLETTGTFKLSKVKMQREGFDVTNIKDALYFLDKGQYKRLDQEMYQMIMSGKVRL